MSDLEISTMWENFGKLTQSQKVHVAAYTLGVLGACSRSTLEWNASQSLALIAREIWALSVTQKTEGGAK